MFWRKFSNNRKNLQNILHFYGEYDTIYMDL